MNQSIKNQSSQPSIQSSTIQPSLDQQPTMPESSETAPQSTSKSLIFVVAIVISLVVGGLVGYISLKQSKPEESTLTPPPASTTDQSTQESAVPYVGTQTIALHDVSGGKSSGTATRTLTETGAIHSAEASLPKLPENTFYELWLIKPNVQQTPVGRLWLGDDGKYYIETDEYPLPPGSVPFEQLLNTIVVSFETADDDSMETRILKGTFTQ